MRLILNILTVFILLYPTRSPGEPEYLMPEEFGNRFRSEVYAIMIDARPAKQYRRNRIEGALGIEKMEKLEVFADTTDIETPVYIYCDGESRSLTVAEYLISEGFGNVNILRGGIREWKAAGKSLDTGRMRKRR